MRAWRTANPGRAKELSKNVDKDARAAYMREWRIANPEKVQEQLRIRREAAIARKKVDAGLPLTSLEKAIYQRQYVLHARKNFPERKAAAKAKRRGYELRSVPRWADPKLIEEIYKECRKVTRLLGIEYHVDHIVPLRSSLVCGLHWEKNLQIIPGKDNIKKSNLTWPDMPE